MAESNKKKAKKIRRRNHVTRLGLASTPTNSPWKLLFESGSDEALITATGFPHAAFQKILCMFETCFEDAYREFVPLKGTPRRRKGRSLQPADALGLGLVYLNSTMRQKTLCLLFGLTEGSISRYIWSSLLALCRCLERCPDARVEWPSPHELETYAAHVHALEPRLHHVFGNLDAVCLNIQDMGPQNEAVDAEQVSVFTLFTPDGCIVWARYLYHNAYTALPSSSALIVPALSEKLANPELTPAKFAILADSEFPLPHHLKNRIIVPLKVGELESIPETDLATEILLSSSISTLRLAPGLRVKDLVHSFPRLTGALPAETSKREQVLDASIRLHNLRVRWTGLAKILTEYAPHWESAIHPSRDAIILNIVPQFAPPSSSSSSNERSSIDIASSSTNTSFPSILLEGTESEFDFEEKEAVEDDDEEEEASQDESLTSSSLHFQYNLSG